MNFDEAEAEIRKTFDTAWADLTSVEWPDDDEFEIPDSATWVRFTCRENDGRQVSLGAPGANRFRHFGLVTIQIFQPAGQNSKDARDKAVTALAAFMGVDTTNGIHFYDVQARQIGIEENGYYQINVLASFRYDEIT